MGTTSKIFLIVIPLVFLIVVGVIFFGGEGLLGKVKGAVLGAKDVLKDLLPDISVGLEEQKAEVTIPDVYREEILNLQKTIEFMLGQGRENCFAKYDPFSDVGEATTSLTLELRGDKTVLRVKSGSGGKQDIADLDAEFLGMKPCVIAGDGGISKNFFKHFIEGEQLIYPYFKPVNSLTISSTHKISASDITGQDLKDNGYLFTPDGEHICFFPTNLISNYDADGIDNDYFTIGEENSIENRITQGKLKMCG